MNESTLIIELAGFYDNLNDPAPALNDIPTALGLTISFLALTWICVGLRVYTRVRVLQSPGWDDAFVVLFLVSFLASLKQAAVRSNHQSDFGNSVLPVFCHWYHSPKRCVAIY